MMQTIRDWASMVKLSHSVFALPFALAGATFATRQVGFSWLPWLWIVLAMIGARNAAMSFNRLVDHRFDAANPRTQERELPSGRLSRGAVWIATVLLTALFVFASFQLNPLCGKLSPLALAIIFGYSFTKRFTWASHLVLGLALAISPVGGWLAIAGSFALLPWLLALAVLLWVAGFDILYSCQDADHDKEVGLFSIPSRFGKSRALNIARFLHFAAWLTLLGVGHVAGAGIAYWIGCGLIGLLLGGQHAMVRADDLSRVGVAFLNLNATIAILYWVSVVATVWFDGITRTS